MRRPSMIFLLAALVGAASALPVAAAEGSNTPDPAAEQDFLGRINDERTSRGLRALSWHTAAASVARDHSEDMADQGRLHHNEQLGSQMSGWAALGENVGVGPSVASIHGAFMGSSSHRSNILGDFSHVGIGVVERDGSLWVTEVFVTPQASSGGGSGSDDTARPRRKKARRSSSTPSVAPARSPAPAAAVSTAPRPAKVRAASAAPVHRIVPPPGPVVGERTLDALARFADDDGFRPLEGCLPREAC